MKQAHQLIKYVGKSSQCAAEIMTIAASALRYILGKPQQILRGNSIIWGWKKMQWIKAMQFKLQSCLTDREQDDG